MSGTHKAGALLGVATMLLIGCPRGSPRAEAAPLEWKEPSQYSVDMVMSRGAEVVTMKRFLDSGLTRTEIAVEGNTIVTIERPDRGVLYMVIREMSPGPAEGLPRARDPEGRET